MKKKNKTKSKSSKITYKSFKKFITQDIVFKKNKTTKFSLFL